MNNSGLIISLATAQARFENSQDSPELDCYTFSKLYTEAKRVSATINNTKLTTANVLDDFDNNLVTMEEAGVSLENVILYCTPAFKKILKNADGMQRTLEVSGGAKGSDRRVHFLDDINKIITMIFPYPAQRLLSNHFAQLLFVDCALVVAGVYMDFLSCVPSFVLPYRSPRKGFLPHSCGMFRH